MSSFSISTAREDMDLKMKFFSSSVAPRSAMARVFLSRLPSNSRMPDLGHAHQILEGEHQVANAERDFGIFFLDGFQDGLVEPPDPGD